MKELIEKYQKELFLNREKKVLAISAESKNLYTGKIVILKGLIEDLESLQSKGKTPTNEDIACEILARFHYTPHPNQRDKYNREKKAFADGAMWVREEYAQSHANKDGMSKEEIEAFAEYSDMMETSEAKYDWLLLSTMQRIEQFRDKPQTP